MSPRNVCGVGWIAALDFKNGRSGMEGHIPILSLSFQTAASLNSQLAQGK